MGNTARAKNKPVNQPFLGLYYDRPPWQVPPAGLVDCNNVRVFNGRVTSSLMGYTKLTQTQLNGTVTLIDTFQFLTGSQITIYGTPTDLYQYSNPSAGTNLDITYITPAYVTGTANPTNGSAAVVGAGTLWNTAIGAGLRKNLRAGDQIFFGSAVQNALAPSGGWYTVLSVTDDTHLTLTAPFTGTGGAQSYTGRQLFAGNASTNKWSSETYPAAGAPDNSDVWVAVNGVDCTFKWNGVTTFGVYQTSMPFIAAAVRRFKNLMCYGDLITVPGGLFLPTSFANSDNGLPFSMNTGVAGQYIVSDGVFQIGHLGVLGNSLLMYMGAPGGISPSGGSSGTGSSGSVVSAQFVGAPNFFVFTEVIRGRGPIASRLVAEFPDRHQFIGQDGEYRYNGLFVQLMNTQVWRTILSGFDLSRSERAFCLINAQFGDLIWALPQISDQSQPGMSMSYVEHYLEQANNFLFKPVTKRDFPFSIFGYFPRGTTLTWNQMTLSWPNYNFPFNNNVFSGSFPQALVGDVNGFLYILYSTDTANGAAYTSFALFGQRLTGNERSRDVVSRVYPFIESGGNYNLTVTLSMYDEVGQATAAITDVQTVNASYTGNRFTDHYRAGRVGQIQFSTPGPNQPWTIQGWDWDVIQGGVR